MSNWTSGYVADIDYTYGYYPELNPYRSKFIMLDHGIVLPKFRTACELGFGQGVSSNIHAAATDVEWYGTDFNPAQAGFAQELASVCGSGASLFDEPFRYFCNRTDLPDFDFIALHGIWSWISDKNRSVIVDFIARKLKVGGVLYVSYNTQPGWAAFAPMRHLMTQHAEVIGSDGRGIVNKVDDAIEFVEKLMATNPIYAAANPHVKDRISKLKEQDRHYLAHEYFNRDWAPIHFWDMAKWLEPAKLDFACSAHYLDQVAQLNLTPEQIEFLSTIPDPTLAQSVKDFMVNAQFRKDYWIKGKRRYSKYQRMQELLNYSVVLCRLREGIEIVVKGKLTEGSVNESIYNPILDVLADNKPRSIKEIVAGIKDSKAVGIPEIVQAILVLINGEYAAFAQSEEQAEVVKPRTDALNEHLLKMARGGSEINILASPVTGGGIVVPSYEQHFLNRMHEGFTTPEELSRETWKLLSADGMSLSVKGKSLTTEEENLTELNTLAEKFVHSGLPVLKALKVV